MKEIKKLDEAQLEQFLGVYLNAYPAIQAAGQEQREKIVKNWTKGQSDGGDVSIYGMINEENAVVGGMKLYDFKMNFHGTIIPVGGVGSVAVGLLNKKEKICKDLITFFLKNCKEKGQEVAALYAFRPSFYKRMGFGYGSKMSKYRVSTGSLPEGGNKNKVVFLSENDKEQVAKCHGAYINNNHGMMEKSLRELDSIFDTEKNRVVAYKDGESILGYAVFEFVKGDNFLKNDIAIIELIYNSTEALLSLCAFLKSQADQIDNIIFYSQDTDFYHLFDDPRNPEGNMFYYVTHETNKDGIGIMYRVLDCKGLIAKMEEVKLYGEPMKIRFEVEDDFLPENSQKFTVDMNSGIKVIEDGEADVTIRLEISDFSSLIMGAVSLNSLYRYGKAEVSNEGYIGKISNILSQLKRPMCNTGF